MIRRRRLIGAVVPELSGIAQRSQEGVVAKPALQSLDAESIYDPTVLVHVLTTVAAGAVAGTLGALLGLGGGVFLVPFLNLAMGLPLPTASGISLVTVIATSSVVSASSRRLRVANLRLGMFLEVFTAFGAALGGTIVYEIAESTRREVFGATLALIALIMIRRLDKRNVIKDPSVDVGVFGGRYHEDESGGEVAYRVKRVPLACIMATLAGVLSTLAGIGGGVIKVPVLNTWCGVPIRVSAATSGLMIGATAMIGAAVYFQHGDVPYELAAGAVLGVLFGSRLGLHFAERSRARHHKIILASVLAAVAMAYFIQAQR